jgi:release factor glutamine methyltransferase
VRMGAAIADAEARLAAAGVEAARREARLLMTLVLNVPTGSVLNEDATVSEHHQIQFENIVERRCAREPYAFVSGRKEFWSLAFDVGSGVLVPRPETETLIEELIRTYTDRKTAPQSICDFGTGCGCLLIAALVEFPRATGIGLDSSEIALSWAARNVAKHGLKTRALLRHLDWNNEMTERFDAILSNPPYIPRSDAMALAPEVVRYEPLCALDGGVDGLAAYRSLVPRIKQTLKQDGTAFLEIGLGQAANVKDILERAGLQVDRIVKDLAGIERCIVARRTHR